MSGLDKALDWIDRLLATHEGVAVAMLSAAASFAVVMAQNCLQIWQIRHIGKAVHDAHAYRVKKLEEELAKERRAAARASPEASQ